VGKVGDVVGLPGEWDEGESEFDGVGADAEACVGDACGDGQGDLQVGVQFRAVDVVGLGVLGDEELVEQDAGACALFTSGDQEAGQVCCAVKVARVSLGDEQSLFASPQVQQVWLVVVEEGVGERRVVVAVAVS
jgi:hypothetical protein